ncbi:hypothetical protein O6H91_03G073100 [Diphasiastrum complanatum]|nr:hypothetical protein O6H91_03G073100 [Diphasiastrum complanatum]
MMKWQVSSQQMLDRDSRMADAAVDTDDLVALVFVDDAAGVASSSHDRYSDSESITGDWEQEALRRMKTDSSGEMNDMSYRQFRNRLKDSLVRIGVRAQMLQELELGELESRSSPRLDAAQLTVENMCATGNPYMSKASGVVKHARKLAGLVHIDEQAIDLQDVLGWLRHLGDLAKETLESSLKLNSSDTIIMTSDESMKNSLEPLHGGWRLPTSPTIALQLAQQDVRDRLANLFQEKEEQYELLGATISDKLHEAEKLEEQYQILQHQINSSGAGASAHLSKVSKPQELLAPSGPRHFTGLMQQSEDEGLKSNLGSDSSPSSHDLERSEVTGNWYEASLSDSGIGKTNNQNKQEEPPAKSRNSSVNPNISSGTVGIAQQPVHDPGGQEHINEELPSTLGSESYPRPPDLERPEVTENQYKASLSDSSIGKANNQNKQKRTAAESKTSSVNPNFSRGTVGIAQKPVHDPEGLESLDEGSKQAEVAKYDSPTWPKSQSLQEQSKTDNKRQELVTQDQVSHSQGPEKKGQVKNTEKEPQEAGDLAEECFYGETTLQYRLSNQSPRKEKDRLAYDKLDPEITKEFEKVGGHGTPTNLSAKSSSGAQNEDVLPEPKYKAELLQKRNVEDTHVRLLLNESFTRDRKEATDDGAAPLHNDCNDNLADNVTDSSSDLIGESSQKIEEGDSATKLIARDTQNTNSTSQLSAYEDTEDCNEHTSQNQLLQVYGQDQLPGNQSIVNRLCAGDDEKRQLRIMQQREEAMKVSNKGSFLLFEGELVRDVPETAIHETVCNKAIQTDDVTILSLVEHTRKEREIDFRARRRDDNVNNENLGQLYNELGRMTKQLQFWRGHNWAEKHQAHPVPTPISILNQAGAEIYTDDIGLVFYYNPRTGFHTMISSKDLEDGFKFFIQPLVKPP